MKQLTHYLLFATLFGAFSCTTSDIQKPEHKVADLSFSLRSSFEIIGTNSDEKLIRTATEEYKYEYEKYIAVVTDRTGKIEPQIFKEVNLKDQKLKNIKYGEDSYISVWNVFHWDGTGDPLSNFHFMKYLGSTEYWGTRIMFGQSNIKLTEEVIEKGIELRPATNLFDVKTKGYLTNDDIESLSITSMDNSESYNLKIDQIFMATASEFNLTVTLTSGEKKTVKIEFPSYGGYYRSIILNRSDPPKDKETGFRTGEINTKLESILVDF
ncbi:hypothetical protein FUAX_04570 [Fulvitalea axinellae]|uniref:Uncharacterized protein n=1 Tax=Fulvitalea axinellae TaxID=1182444 RepID=A0AAU9D775_9BACT|nr:hypothetical protein FUAX_04570 [Fulvitalea axinellae]